MLSQTTKWALHANRPRLDRPEVEFVKRGESHFCVARHGDGVAVSYPVSIYSHPNSSIRYFGITEDPH